MKLLFDQNISFRLIPRILELYPEAKQVRQLGLEDSSDKSIFKFAKENDYTIVTFDSDFSDMNTLYGFPPKVIWIRVGNTTTTHLEKLFYKYFETIKEFENSDFGCLEIVEK